MTWGLMIFLSILSGLFLLFGIIGIFVFISEKDLFGLVFYVIWSLLGAFLFVFFLRSSRIKRSRHAKHNDAKIEHHNKSTTRSIATETNFVVQILFVFSSGFIHFMEKFPEIL